MSRPCSGSSAHHIGDVYCTDTSNVRRPLADSAVHRSASCRQQRDTTAWSGREIGVSNGWRLEPNGCGRTRLRLEDLDIGVFLALVKQAALHVRVQFLLINRRLAAERRVWQKWAGSPRAYRAVCFENSKRKVRFDMHSGT